MLIKDGVQATIVMGVPALVAHAVAGIVQHKLQHAQRVIGRGRDSRKREKKLEDADQRF